ncbi:small ribosomal subunit protein mS40 [Ambystoma mexicanum]|uniref:small ribosomal subunit protein mS40 n=1 Tax=Ambystoma mexicanum TaxID=8296 RepID=UPI0037E8D95B
MAAPLSRSATWRPLLALARALPRAQEVPAAVTLRRVGRPFAQVFSTQVESEDAALATSVASPATFDTISRYKEKPWDYLTSEEYLERYGSRPVWADYRRNHKGGIPPQKTRKTCIRGEAICGNPCPICRDQKLGLHHQNVKLLEQFISPYTGEILHPTRTGVCMKQQKKLTAVIGMARDLGLLSSCVPFVDFQDEDYTNSHGAVTKTPPAPALQTGAVWYPWYEWQQPPEKEVALIRKIYRRYLKGGPPPSPPELGATG